VLSNPDVRLRYDQFLGLSSSAASPEFDEDSLYAHIIRKRDFRKAKMYQEEPKKPFDLDSELRKLQEIKLKRDQELHARREKAMKKR
jgi:hypothetical protein